jgi:putative methionine-R-sulfoxide reductase with GAF domain
MVQEYRGRLREVTRENWQVQSAQRALESVNREYEYRLTKQRDSMTALYSQIHKFDSLSLNHTLEALLETIEIFSQAISSSVWAFIPEKQSLIMVAERGTYKGTRPPEIPVDSSIEGYCVRNNTLFSIRLIAQYENLKKMESGRNIITIPISFSGKVWGVLNIEEMPFEKYNRYTEQVIQIVVSLAASSIQQAVEYEQVFQSMEINESTSLPRMTMFMKILQEEMKRLEGQQGTLSVIIFEIINSESLIQDFGPGMLTQSIIHFHKLLETEELLDWYVFHYKEANQLAIIAPHLDTDGAALFCFNAMERVAQQPMQKDGQEKQLEIGVGYASLQHAKQRLEDLLQQAESLLEMTKL